MQLIFSMSLAVADGKNILTIFDNGKVNNYALENGVQMDGILAEVRTGLTKIFIGDLKMAEKKAKKKGKGKPVKKGC